MNHVPPAEGTDSRGTQHVDDNISHGVSQPGWITKHWLLHSAAENLMHGKLDNFPQRSGSSGD